MPCPTCDHTMTCIGKDREGYALFWCPRCGTRDSAGVNPVVPKLVERCRQLQASMIDAEQSDGLEVLRMLGITEAINVPQNRGA